MTIARPVPGEPESFLISSLLSIRVAHGCQAVARQDLRADCPPIFAPAPLCSLTEGVQLLGRGAPLYTWERYTWGGPIIVSWGKVQMIAYENQAALSSSGQWIEGGWVSGP
jgi:hypothetical protein